MSAISPASAPAASRRDLAKEKERRQKKLLALLSVVFLALVGFQLPRLMGGGASTAPAATGETPTTVPTPVVSAPDTELPDTDRVVVEPQSGQLLSFGLFKSKDPFVQQVSDTPTAPSSGLPTTTPPTTGPQTRPPTRVSAPTVTTSTPQVSPVSFPPTAPTVSTTPPSPTTATTPSAPAPAPATTQPAAPAVPATTPGTVALSINGVCEIVALRGTFPGNEDFFRVTWIAKDGKSVKIAVVGGAYEGGAAAATLKRGEKLTLVNTADGTRYALRLLPACEVETEPVPSTTTRTSTTPAPSTAPSGGEPIVEDELDSGSAEDAAAQGD